MIAITAGARMALSARVDPAKRSSSPGAASTGAAAVMTMPPPSQPADRHLQLQAFEPAGHDAIATGAQAVEAFIAGLPPLDTIDHALVADLAVTAFLAAAAIGALTGDVGLRAGVAPGPGRLRARRRGGAEQCRGNDRQPMHAKVTAPH